MSKVQDLSLQAAEADCSAVQSTDRFDKVAPDRAYFKPAKIAFGVHKTSIQAVNTTGSMTSSLYCGWQNRDPLPLLKLLRRHDGSCLAWKSIRRALIRQSHANK